MPYGLDRIAIARAEPEAATAVYRAWRKLSPDKRLAAVERRLNATNLGDGYPLAL